jgi:hypothetical protein
MVAIVRCRCLLNFCLCRRRERVQGACSKGLRMEAGEVFTKHLRCLLAGEADDGEEVRLHLRNVVCRELRRMRVWHLPPSCLGYEGISWSDPDAIDDLVQDAYITCIFCRLAKLARFLRATGVVEGAVHWKLKMFLVDCQRGSNTTRRRILNNVKGASLLLLQSGSAKLASPGPLTGAAVILALGAVHAVGPQHLEEFFADELRAKPFAESICRESAGSQGMLAELIQQKFAQGLQGFAIGRLTNLLVGSCKTFHHTLDSCTALEVASSDLLDTVIADFRTLGPQDRCERSEDFSQLVNELTEHIKSTSKIPRIQDRAIALLHYLASSIRDGEDPRMLTQAEIARRLGVSYNTLHEDIARLRTFQLLRLTSKADAK